MIFYWFICYGIFNLAKLTIPMTDATGGPTENHQDKSPVLHRRCHQWVTAGPPEACYLGTGYHTSQVDYANQSNINIPLDMLIPKIQFLNINARTCNLKDSHANLSRWYMYFKKLQYQSSHKQ